MAKKAKFDEKWSKIYFVTCFSSQLWSQCRRFCFCRVLLPWHMGNWFKSSERVFSYQPPFWIVLHSWKFSLVFILIIFIIFRFLVLNTVEVSDQPFRVVLKRVNHFTRSDSKGENASKGFVLLPASLSNVLHLAMFNLSTDM